jgi:hypothetical protein
MACEAFCLAFGEQDHEFNRLLAASHTAAGIFGRNPDLPWNAC